MANAVQPLNEEPAGEGAPMDSEECLNGAYEWTIKNFSKLNEPKLYSEKFEAGTYIWRLLVLPKGSSGKHLSVFLEYPEAKFTPAQMAPNAAFKLMVVNRDPAKNFHKAQGGGGDHLEVRPQHAAVNRHTGVPLSSPTTRTAPVYTHSVDDASAPSLRVQHAPPAPAAAACDWVRHDGSPAPRAPDPARLRAAAATHHFSESETDWGYAQMLPSQDVSAAAGYILEDGSLTVRVEIGVQKNDRYAYDSKDKTGFVGLKNQGATCYMNSLLQYLYNLPYFRKAVYHMPVPESEEPSKSLPVALQSLCYKLQYSRTAVSTKDLTKSFGWGTHDAFMQHDVQELNRVLCEKLEDKMKNTNVERAIHNLFEGHTYNFIECINIDFKSTRKESFMDLSLDVKGCKDIYQSFERYCQVEVLSGQDQYKTDDHGMQDARKGILFEALPPVLQLQLKRFEYDCTRDTMVKINDRYEFYTEIDLDIDGGKFLSSTAVRNVYKLHSVLVHSGDVHGGHYYAYIRADGQQWLKFDDERVVHADQKEAMDAQFGDDGGALGRLPAAQPVAGHGPHKTGGGARGEPSTAYMLVYVRVQDWDTIMCDVTKEDIAPHLLDKLEQEQKEKEQKRRDKAQARLYCSVATDDDFTAQVGSTYFDLLDYSKLAPERSCFRIRKHTKFSDFKEEVAKRLGIPAAQQRYWTWRQRCNNTFRPALPLALSDEMMLLDLREQRELMPSPTTSKESKSSLMDIKLYLEMLPPEHEPFDVRKDVLFFVKEYDPVLERLSYVGHYVMPLNIKVSQVERFLFELLYEDRLPAGTPLALYEEVKFDPQVMAPRLDPAMTLKDAEIENGDIICVQRHMPQDKPEAAGCRFPTVEEFMAYHRNRRVVLQAAQHESAVAAAAFEEQLAEARAAYGRSLVVHEDMKRQLAEALTQAKVALASAQGEVARLQGQAACLQGEVACLQGEAPALQILEEEQLDALLQKLETAKSSVKLKLRDKKRARQQAREEAAAEEAKLCGMCCEARIDTALSCGHVLCGACCDKLAGGNYPCASCRRPVTSRMRIYL